MIQKGPYVLHVGENGAGKSTLVKTIVGQSQPTDSEVVIDRQALSDYDIAS